VLLILVGGLISFRSVGELSMWNRGTTLNVSQFQPGSVQLVDGLWVVRQSDGAYDVFLNRDPHLGHPTEWVDSKHEFISPAHGETYSIGGTCLAGPCGSGSLYKVASRQEGDYLRVLPEQIISGGVRDGSSWWSGITRFFGISEKPEKPGRH
jgi:nitrite reductase/ring-hydroxylating ferredoxin subunit